MVPPSRTPQQWWGGYGRTRAEWLTLLAQGLESESQACGATRQGNHGESGNIEPEEKRKASRMRCNKHLQRHEGVFCGQGIKWTYFLWPWQEEWSRQMEVRRPRVSVLCKAEISNPDGERLAVPGSDAVVTGTPASTEAAAAIPARG